jgi:16S rRNA (uracil1498-N3)-methyltransferase
MSLPRFYQPLLPITGSIELEESEARHASQVLRLSVGSDIVVFDGQGGEALARLSQVTKRSTVAEIIRRTDTSRELDKPLELYVALPKGDRQKTLIDGLVQFGTTHLIPLTTQRSVAQPTGNALERLHRSVVESSKQCGRNQLLRVASPRTIEDLASSISVSQTLSLVAHPYGQPQTLQQVAHVSEACNSARVVVGPEGGLTEEEVFQLSVGGWTTVTLGPRLLRIEYAALQVAAWWSSFHQR